MRIAPGVFRVAVVVATLACGSWAGWSPAADRKRPPNVVLILMDDMGWRDVGFMGNDFVETPRLDRLAAGGALFTQAYASAPNCAPTRACLMSGLYTPRHGIYTVVDPRQPPGSPWQKLMGAESRSELDTRTVTVAEALQGRGYATGFFGMWNLGRGRTGPVTPGGQGFGTVVFPETIGFGKDAYFDAAGDYLSDRLADSVITFMESSRGRPFFAYLADHAVHAPFDPPADLMEKYSRKAGGARGDEVALAATVEGVDRNVGRILDAIERLGLTRDTLVIFTSDNGGTRQYTAPLRGGKGELYEGGGANSTIWRPIPASRKTSPRRCRPRPSHSPARSTSGSARPAPPFRGWQTRHTTPMRVARAGAEAVIGTRAVVPETRNAPPDKAAESGKHNKAFLQAFNRGSYNPTGSREGLPSVPRAGV